MPPPPRLARRGADGRAGPSRPSLHAPPPFDTGGRVDALKLADAGALGDLLARHGNVRQIVCGHTHRTCSGAWRGIPFANLGATTYNLGVHPQGQGWGERQLGPVNAGVMLLSGDNVVVHTHDLRPDNQRVTEDWGGTGMVEAIIARGGRLAP